MILTLSLSLCKKEKDDGQNYFPTYFTCQGTIDTYNNTTLVSKDNNLIICGNTNDSGMFLLKISKAGTLIWKNAFTNETKYVSSGVTENLNGELFVFGSCGDNYDFLNKVFIAKISDFGDTLWTKIYNSVSLETGKFIINTLDNNLLICSNYLTQDGASWGLSFRKIDYNGNILWRKFMDDTVILYPNHLLETESGDYIMTGIRPGLYSKYPSEEIYLLKLDHNGNKLWDKKVGPARSWGYCTIELSNGNTLTCGSQLVDSVNRIILIKMDALGNLNWIKKYGSENLYYSGQSMKLNSDETITIATSSYDFKLQQNDLMLLKIDPEGHLLWIKSHGDPKNNEIAYNLIKDFNDDNIITGTINSSSSDNNSKSIFMTKFDSDGNIK